MGSAFLRPEGVRQATSLHCAEPGHSFVDEMDDAGSSAQRIRIGLTGLAFAFLLVLLGSVISRSGNDGESAAVNAEQAAANEAEPDEPLAKLGVAPGGESVNNSSSEE
jgi:hypothetical protein